MTKKRSDDGNSAQVPVLDPSLKIYHSPAHPTDPPPLRFLLPCLPAQKPASTVVSTLLSGSMVEGMGAMTSPLRPNVRDVREGLGGGGV